MPRSQHFFTFRDCYNLFQKQLYSFRAQFDTLFVPPVSPVVIKIKVLWTFLYSEPCQGFNFNNRGSNPWKMILREPLP